jgi:hypothetical protein
VIKFKTPGEFAAHLREIRDRRLRLAYISILDMIGSEARDEARDRIIGRIRPLQQVGPFNAWAPLQDSTVEQKARYGWGKNGNPESMLYATGELADSIGYRVERGRLRVIVGTNDPIGLYQERGTYRIPPRPFLGPAMIITTTRLYFKMERIFGRTLKGLRLGRI